MATKMGMKRDNKKPIKRTVKVDKLDSVCFKYIRLKSGGYCKRCKRYVGVTNLDCAHLFGRLRHTVRWNEKNLVALCRKGEGGRKGCHYTIDNFPTQKTSFMYDILSQEEIAELERLANLTTKEYPVDKEALFEYYKKRLKEE